MSKALCPGSFDPMTLGHIDVIKRCASSFDKVCVLIGYNELKNGFMSPEKRLEYVKDALRDHKNVEIEIYSGLTVDYAYENGCDIIVKGIRNSTDLEYENEMAEANAYISLDKYGKAIQTLYLPSAPSYINVSSSVVRRLVSLNLPVDRYVHNADLLYKLLEK